MIILTQSLLLIHTYAAGSSSLEDYVDFANSGGDIDIGMNSSCKSINDVDALDASHDLEDTTMELEAVDTTAESKQQEDLSILTVEQLKDRLRGLNLAVSGLKQELIDRLNGHLYGNGKHFVVYCI